MQVDRAAFPARAQPVLPASLKTGVWNRWLAGLIPSTTRQESGATISVASRGPGKQRRFTRAKVYPVSRPSAASVRAARRKASTSVSRPVGASVSVERKSLKRTALFRVGQARRKASNSFPTLDQRLVLKPSSHGANVLRSVASSLTALTPTLARYSNATCINCVAIPSCRCFGSARTMPIQAGSRP